MELRFSDSQQHDDAGLRDTEHERNDGVYPRYLLLDK